MAVIALIERSLLMGVVAGGRSGGSPPPWAGCAACDRHTGVLGDLPALFGAERSRPTASVRLSSGRKERGLVLDPVQDEPHRRV